MQVIYDDSFQSLVKACILSEVKGYEPVTEASLSDTNFVSVSDFTLNELFIEWDWAKGTPHNISSLESAVSLALKHRNCSYSLVFKVISEALNHGVDYVLTRKSLHSKRFCNLVLSVREELRNAKLNMRFTREGDSLLGRYLFSHNIADLLLSFYQKRFPGKQVIISNQERSYALSVAGIKVMPLRIPIPVGVQAPSPVTLNAFI